MASIDYEKDPYGKWRKKGSATARGYGTNHQRERAFAIKAMRDEDLARHAALREVETMIETLRERAEVLRPAGHDQRERWMDALTAAVADGLGGEDAVAAADAAVTHDAEEVRDGQHPA